MTVSDTARYYKIYFTSADNTQWVPASVNSSSNATTARTVNQRPINPFGRIVYTSADTNYTSGSTLAATKIWSQYKVTLGYSFNRTGAALTLTTATPVYIKCAPQANGSAIIDADTPYVQALPSTEDGKIYIYLGVAVSATQVEIYQDHPVYYYKDSAIRLWSNQAAPTVTSTYSSTGTDPINGTAVNAALQTLDSSITATSGQAISSVTITDGKITNSTKIDVGAPKATWYGTCSTTASTAEKAVTCSNFDFTSGAIIGVLFSTANTAATPTLNVNSKGAKSIYVGASTPSSTANVLKWSANTMVYFMYDGTYFRYITSVSAGSVAPSRGANTWYGTSSTGATTQAKTSTIDNFVLTKGAIVCIAFSTANTYTSAKITLNINSTGAKDVYYNNAVTSSTNTLLWDAGETVTFIYNGSYYYFVCKSKGGTVSDVQINNTSILSNGVANIITNSAYDSSTNKIATMSDITDSDKVFVVNVTLTSLTGGTSDKSSTDIYNAARAGKMVIAKVPYNGVQMVAVLVAAARDTSDDIAVFQYQNQKPSGLLSSFGFAKLTIVMNTVAIEVAAADAATLGGTYLYSGGSANDGITLAAENGIDINYLSQSPLCNGNVYTLRHTNAVSATTGNAAVYPITIDAQGHISSYGSAVTIPAAVSVKGNAETNYRTGQVNLTPANLGLGNVTNDKQLPIAGGTMTGALTLSGAPTNNLHAATKKYVDDSVSSITNAMLFKGTVGKASGGSGTVNAIPTSSVRIGDTYKIVDESKSIVAANSTTGTAVTAEIGDVIVATATTPKWTVIPSGDEPSGTVTSVATGDGLTGGAITTSGTLKANLRSFTKLTNASAAATETANRVYPVALDKDGYLSVNVPWTNVNNSYVTSSGVTQVSSGDGLTGGPITTTGTLKANLRSFTKLTNDSAAATETSGRIYPVVLDKSGYLSVNVPWTNVNSSYAASSHTHGNITNAGALGTASRIVVTDANKKITVGSIDPANLVVTSDSRLSDSRTPKSHTHGKITNAGAIAGTDNVTIANNDRLIISDASDSSVLKNTSIVFDGSTATKALTQKGT